MSDVGSVAEQQAPGIASALLNVAAAGVALYGIAVIFRGRGDDLGAAVSDDALDFAEFAIAAGGLYWLVVSPAVPQTVKTVVYIAVISFLLAAGVSGRLTRIAAGYSNGDGLIRSFVREVTK